MSHPAEFYLPEGVQGYMKAVGDYRVDFFYPDRYGGTTLEVGLCDVRAADTIRIHYDFDRDGYVIEQAGRFEFLVGEEIDEDWQEVAFVKAWAREPKGDTP